ncbi:hypothetical protein KIN20_004764, partial [Parelaphostrongylus tenuis]
MVDDSWLIHLIASKVPILTLRTFTLQFSNEETITLCSQSVLFQFHDDSEIITETVAIAETKCDPSGATDKVRSTLFTTPCHICLLQFCHDDVPSL